MMTEEKIISTILMLKPSTPMSPMGIRMGTMFGSMLRRPSFTDLRQIIIMTQIEMRAQRKLSACPALT